MTLPNHRTTDNRGILTEEHDGKYVATFLTLAHGDVHGTPSGIGDSHESAARDLIATTNKLYGLHLSLYVDRSAVIYLAMVNMPGCLPDSPAFRTLSEDKAREALADLLDEHADGYVSGDPSPEMMAEANIAGKYAQEIRDEERDFYTFDGYYYGIETCSPEDDEEARRAALAILEDEDLDDVEETTYGDNMFSCGSGEFLVLTEDEADDVWDERLDSYLDDCVLCELEPSTLAMYFDREAWKRDARHDGRGHAISSYDGSENDSECGEYVIFRIN